MTALVEHVDRYLALRRALGYQLRDHGRFLASFIAYLEEAGLSSVTTAAAEAWSSAGSSEGAVAKRLSVVRDFSSYLSAFEVATEVPPNRLLPGGCPRRTPYLYSDDEIAALLGAARSLKPESLGLTMATLIGLLSATGLRPGEAYCLDRVDVDLLAGRLAVIEAKSGKSRLLPIHPSTVEVLGRYAAWRDALAGRDEEAFFLGRFGRRITSVQAAGAFRHCCTSAQVAAPPGRRAPRLYDFRHRFAVQTLIDWNRAGADVARLLPVLSAYLGHLAPASTYWYLQATPELFEPVADRLGSFLGEAR